MAYTAKDVMEMRNAIKEDKILQLRNMPGYDENLARASVSPSYVEDILKTYILAGVGCDDLVKEINYARHVD